MLGLLVLLACSSEPDAPAAPAPTVSAPPPPGAPPANAPADRFAITEPAPVEPAPGDPAREPPPAEGDRARLLEATTRYDDAEGAEMARRLQAELALLGKPAPELSVASWIQGRGDLSARATVVAFFPPGHPAAPSTVAALQALATREAGRGLAVVGITPAGSAAPSTAAWLRELGVTFPVAVDLGTAEAYRRSGPVSAVLVVGGEVVWTGNPGRIDAALLAKHL